MMEKTARHRYGTGTVFVDWPAHSCSPPDKRLKFCGRTLPDGARFECDCGANWRLVGSTPSGSLVWGPT